jgi:hypothetical protein
LGLQCDLPDVPSWVGADAVVVVWTRSDTEAAVTARLRLLNKGLAPRPPERARQQPF